MSDYNIYRAGMRSGDLLEFASSSVIGGLIRLKTGKDVNHSSLLLRLNEIRGLKDRVFTLESLEHGIDIHLLSNRLENFIGSVYWYPLRQEYDKYREDIICWSLQQIDKKYDYKSLISSIFSRVSVESDLFFCSEFVQDAYTEVGMIEKEKACWPGEFGKFNLHYGRLKIHERHFINKKRN